MHHPHPCLSTYQIQIRKTTNCIFDCAFLNSEWVGGFIAASNLLASGKDVFMGGWCCWRYLTSFVSRVDGLFLTFGLVEWYNLGSTKALSHQRDGCPDIASQGISYTGRRDSFKTTFVICKWAAGTIHPQLLVPRRFCKIADMALAHLRFSRVPV